MAKQILKNAKVYLAGYDLSGDHNKVGLTIAIPEKEITSFTSSAEEYMAGLPNFTADGNGYWNLDALGNGVDNVLFSRLAVADDVLTICPMTGAPGEVAYFGQAFDSQYNPGGKVGEVLPFGWKARGDGRLLRGVVLASGAQGVSGNGSAFQVGAVGAAQQLYAALHVTAVSGTAAPTITVELQSAPTVDFASPTTRITFNPVTAIGAQFAAPIAGPITDQYWRMLWTVSGTTPSLTIVGVMGIL